VVYNVLHLATELDLGQIWRSKVALTEGRSIHRVENHEGVSPLSWMPFA
jgi:hypothetical protein